MAFTPTCIATQWAPRTRIRLTMSDDTLRHNYKFKLQLVLRIQQKILMLNGVYKKNWSTNKFIATYVEPYNLLKPKPKELNSESVSLSDSYIAISVCDL